jgi:nitrite reductase/ring-hydroxylating ferredoxin subunit
MTTTSSGKGGPHPPRRAVLAAGVAGVAGALAGCAVYGGQPPPPPDANGNRVAGTGDVPVGGGVIAGALGVVVTQPTDGDFRGFSSICTHQGCTVSEVNNGTINCFCHGSQYSIEDGSVVQAAQGLTPDQQAPLPEVGIVVEDDTISLP